MVTRVLMFVISLVLTAPVLLAFQPPAEPQSGFVPVESLPPADQLPAAPLLITAYAFVWVAVLFYVWTVWQRLNKIEKEMQALQRRSQTR